MKNNCLNTAMSSAPQQHSIARRWPLLLKWVLAVLIGCFTFGVSAGPQKIEAPAWLALQVSQKESTRAALTWLKRHQVDKDYAVSRDDVLPSRLQRAGVAFVGSDVIGELPYSAIGRLFARRGDDISSCTAFFIGPATAMTAAHCVMNIDGRWNVDLVLVSGLGETNVSAHGVQCALLHRRWGETGNQPTLPLDYALLKIDTLDSHPYLALDYEPARTAVEIIGYRSNCCGNRMLALNTPPQTIERQKSHYLSKNNPLGMGSSGSPWISASSGKVISLNAQYPRLGEMNLAGPQFNKMTRAMQQHFHTACQ